MDWLKMVGRLAPEARHGAHRHRTRAVLDLRAGLGIQFRANFETANIQTRRRLELTLGRGTIRGCNATSHTD